MIRGLQLRDSASIRRLRKDELTLSGLPFGWKTHSPVAAALASESPLPRRRWHSYVYEEDGKPVALAQARVRPRSDEWEVVYLCSARTQGEAHNPGNGEMWRQLLEYLGRDAALSGARRVYAKVPVDTPYVDTFYDAGFHCYSKEHLFVIDKPAPAGDLGQIRLRAQSRSDAWAIHQVYNRTTPSMVRQVEPLTSDQWHLPIRVPIGAARLSGVVAEDREGVVAYFREEAIGDAMLVRVLFRPERHSELDGVVGTVIAMLKPAARRPVVCSLLEHQLELSSVLEGLGFDFMGVQLLMVKHTVEVVRVMQKRSVPAVNGRHSVADGSSLSRGASILR